MQAGMKDQLQAEDQCPEPLGLLFDPAAFLWLFSALFLNNWLLFDLSSV